MKKLVLIAILVLFFFPMITFAGGNNEDNPCETNYKLQGNMCVYSYTAHQRNGTYYCPNGGTLDTQTRKCVSKYAITVDSSPADKGTSSSGSSSEGVSLGGSSSTGGGTYDTTDEDSTNNSCQSLLGSPRTPGEPAFYLNKAFSVMRYAAIIILVITTMMDFITAVAAHDEDSLKKASSKVVKRAILCVLIFFLPMLIEFILQYINDRAIDLCGIGGSD